MRLYLSRLQVIILSLILAVGATVGSVVFNNASAESEHPALEQSLPKDEKGQTVFPKNKNGQTYGSAAFAVSPDNEPDLIKAWGVDGNLGYVLKSDLDGDKPKNPEEAIAQQKLQKGDRTIPLYDVDGKTVIGKFIMSGAAIHN
jgi:hypothetical protein